MQRTCARAVRIGLPAVIFTEHLDFAGWMAAPEDFLEDERQWIDEEGLLLPPQLDAEGYFESILRCRCLFPDLRILTGVEFGQPHLHGQAASAMLDLAALDRVNGSLHTLPFRGHRSEPATLFREMSEPAEVIWTYLAEIPHVVDDGDFEVFTQLVAGLGDPRAALGLGRHGNPGPGRGVERPGLAGTGNGGGRSRLGTPSATRSTASTSPDTIPSHASVPRRNAPSRGSLPPTPELSERPVRCRRRLPPWTMANSLGSVVLRVSDIGRAAAFWSQALGYARHPDNPAFLESPDGVGSGLHLDEDDAMHLDIYAAEGADLETEVARLVDLGATRVDWHYPEDADFVVLADTEGNLFCLVDNPSADEG
jgi:catechol 2,3-dioxygenase-like lactoylglutathione lyase family enzyme